MKSLLTCLLVTTAAAVLVTPHADALRQTQKDRADLERIERALAADVPRVLCLSPSLATGGQPSERAFARLAENGFRSVLNLRTPSEGVDLEKERAAVEGAGMRYLHIPVAASAPRAEQAEEFVRVVREKANHPMLIHCATANRVGAFMLIYRVLEHGWGPEQAEAEAEQIGLRSPELKKFARDFIEGRGDGRLVHEGLVAAPPREVWAAFTTKKGQESWMVAHSEIELKVGGLMRTHYDPKGSIGDPGTIENTIISYDPERMLSFRVTKAPARFPFPNAVKGMWTVIYFEPSGPQATRVRFVGLGFGEDEESKKMRAFFDRGNAYTLKKLQERFSPPPSDR